MEPNLKLLDDILKLLDAEPSKTLRVTDIQYKLFSHNHKHPSQEFRAKARLAVEYLSSKNYLNLFLNDSTCELTYPGILKLNGQIGEQDFSTVKNEKVSQTFNIYDSNKVECQSLKELRWREIINHILIVLESMIINIGSNLILSA